MEAKKKYYKVWATEMPEGTKVHNYLEDVDYTVEPGDVVVTGLVGEQWIVKPDKFDKTYRHVDSNMYETIPDDTIYLVRDPEPDEVIKTSWAELHPLIGEDVVVCRKEDPTDQWTIKVDVFKSTYEQV